MHIKELSITLRTAASLFGWIVAVSMAALHRRMAQT
jgi:hypothetical protein